MTKFVNKKSNPLQIRIGDRVTIKFDHMASSNPNPFDAEVIDIIDRIDIGQDAMIYYRRYDGVTNEPKTPDGCSVSHVIAVVHGPYQQGPKVVRNIFRDLFLADLESIKKEGREWLGYYSIGGIRVGMQNKLVMHALAQATDELTRSYDSEKFNLLWAKAGYPGKVASPDEDQFPSRHYTCVRWKVFAKWVLKNRHKLLMTRKELEEAGREYQKAWEDSYYKDLESEREDGQYADDADYADDFDYGYDADIDSRYG